MLALIGLFYNRALKSFSSGVTVSRGKVPVSGLAGTAQRVELPPPPFVEMIQGVH